MSEYTLKVSYRVWAPKDGGDYAAQDREATFSCTVEDGQLLIPPDALRIIHKRSKGVLGVNSLDWVGDRPSIFKCGALTEEQAAQLSERVNSQADIAMSLLDATEPEEASGLSALLGPREGPIRVIGEADYEKDVPLLPQNRWGETE